MAAEEKWYFSKEQLANTPSKRCGVDPDKELSYRQQAANFIQDMGQRLKVTQLCINTAIVYMHRFYIFHSFTVFHRNSISTASLFLAAKVEEQPRKLEHVITVAHWCLKGENKLDTKSELYQENAQELVFNENVLLQTLGFDVGIDHPHTHVVKCCHLVRANKELAQTSYFMASNSLHLTTMCLQYKPTLVACFCIHLACKWSNWEIPQSSEGKDWFYYVDSTVTLEQLEQLTAEFLVIYEKCPSRLKKINSKRNEESFNLLMSGTHQPNSLDMEPRKIRPPTSSSTGRPESSSQRSGEDPKKQHPHHSRVDYQQYKEKKQREAAAAAAAKDGRPVHHQNMPRPPASGVPPPSASSQHHSTMKREQMKREMAGRDIAKREGMKSIDSRREQPQPRPGDTVPPNELKRVREEVDSTQKRVFESGSQMEVQAKRAREEVAPPMHHQLDPSRSNHMHPSSHPLKRVRDNSSNGGSNDPGYPPISQAKRPREGTDPMMDILDSSKRPREPMDSTANKQEDFDSISCSSDNKQKFSFQEASKAPQTKMPNSNFSSSSSQKNFHHKPAAPSRPPSSNEMDRSKLLPSSHTIKQERPFDMQRLPTLNISPLTQRSKSPLEVKSPDMSRKIADVLSGQPSSHLFSPEDDREDSALPDVSFSLEVPPVLMSRAKSSSPMPKHPSLMPPAKPLTQESSQPSQMFTPTKSPVTPTKLHLSSSEKQRMRTPSLSGGDSALVPVVRKLEDVPGFQSLNKSSGSIKLEKDMSPAPPTPGKDTIPPLMKEPDLKSLLAESMSLPTVVAPLKHDLLQSIFDPTDDVEPDAKLEHHHKKKKKEKHGKKDKEKSKEDKKHKHKKKDKDKSKERKATSDEVMASHSIAAPIKLTIPKEKIMPEIPSHGIKIKIPKERLKVEEPICAPQVAPAGSTGQLKIKIGKELISERRLPDTPDAKKRAAGSQVPRNRGFKQNGHLDSRKVPLKGESGSLQPPPGCRQ